MRLVVPLVLLAGCVGETATLEEGCLDALPGADVLDGQPSRLLERINCYRRYVGVNPLEVTDRTQQAVENHLDYLVKNRPFADDSLDPRGSRVALLGESSTQVGYTGDDPFDRNVATGALTFDGDLSVSSVWGWFVRDARIAGDVLMALPYARDAFFQPLALGAGFAQAEVDEGSAVPSAYVELISPVPSGRHVSHPIVYPKDGQTGIPTGWVDAFAGPADPFVAGGVVGFPITVTVSAPEAEKTVHSPYQVALEDVELVDSEGKAVPFQVVAPVFPERLPLRTTVAVVPVQELLPGLEYAFRATVTATGATWTVESTFGVRSESFVVEAQREEFAE